MLRERRPAMQAKEVPVGYQHRPEIVCNDQLFTSSNKYGCHFNVVFSSNCSASLCSTHHFGCCCSYFVAFTEVGLCVGFRLPQSIRS